jgi:putative redox protein
VCKWEKPFKDIHVVFYLEGDIKEDKAAKAAQLSLRNTVRF